MRICQMKHMTLFTLVLVLSGMVRAQTPDWVAGKSGTYPDQYYITGVGSGDTRNEAENQARAQIAQVFRIQLNARFSTNKTETLRGTKGEGESLDVTRSRVDVGTTKTLEGSEIADVWQDPQTMEYYALAVLDKEKASSRLAGQIAALDSDLVDLTREADTAATKLGKLRLLASIAGTAARRRDLNSDYSILSGSGQGIPLTGVSADEASSRLSNYCSSQITFDLSADGADSRGAAQVVSDALTEHGFKLNVSNDTLADLSVHLSSHLEPSGTPVGGWYYCRWNVAIRLIDNSRGNIIVSVSRSGRSGQLTVERAKERAQYDLDRAVKALAGDMLKKLLE